MIRLVKTRVKAIEHFPEWILCCKPAIDFFTGLSRTEERMADFDSISVRPPVMCRTCDNRYPFRSKQIKMADVGGSWVQLEILDFDEGPLETKP